MNQHVLTVYKSPFPKLRLGKDYDGGYIISEIPNVTYKILISGGINKDISFEIDFINEYSNVKTFAFDGTINNLPMFAQPNVCENKNITFVKKNISNVNDEFSVNLHDIINLNENIFVKMDIEGSEISWVKSLNDEQMNKFEQIVMEFHFPISNDEISDVFEKINKTHYLIHFHPNNCCGVIRYKDVNIPNIFECTYLHKKYFTNIPELNTDVIPGIFDMKNTPNKEIEINYPPFVNLLNVNL